MKRNNILVLYSGGKDSSATSVEIASAGHRVKLFTFQAGLSELTGFLGDSAPDIRFRELLKVFPENIDPERVVVGNTYIIRKLGIEQTNAMHVVYPITLALAVHCSAIKYCMRHKIDTIACGYSGYQSKKDAYVEQNENFVRLTKSFVKEYGINYKTPVINKSEQEIKDVLEYYGISSNSLENKSLFGGIPFDIKYAQQYWDYCIPFCREYLDKAQGS